MSKIDLRIDESTKRYLLDTCEKLGDKSINYTVKNLLKWCQFNGVDPSKNTSTFDEEVRKMIEHIHLSVPHLMLSSSLNSMATMENLSEQRLKELSKRAMSRLNQRCGDFQNVQYEKTSFTFNQSGLRESPESEELTKWKLP